MEFTFTTDYDRRSMSVMACALRKTVRRRSNRIVRAFGYITAVLASLLIFPVLQGGDAFSVKAVITVTAVIAIAAVLLWEDKLNGFFAHRQLLPSTAKSVATFFEGGFRSSTDIGDSFFRYGSIVHLAEDERYFVLVFGPNHAQICDKESIDGGDADTFRTFIESKTGKPVVAI